MTRAGSSRSSLRYGEKGLMAIVMVWILMLALDPSLISAQLPPPTPTPAPASAPGSAPASAPGSAPAAAPGSAPTLSAVPPAPERGPFPPSSPTSGPSPSRPDTNNVSLSPSGGGGLSGGAKAGIAIAVIFGVAIAGALFILRKRSRNVRRARRNSYMGGPGAML